MENSDSPKDYHYSAVHLDEKAALAAEINRTTKGEVQVPVTLAENTKPKRPLWRRLVRIALTASAGYWLVKAAYLYPWEQLDVSDLDALGNDIAGFGAFPFEEFAELHPHQPPHDDVDCGNLHDAQWTYLDTLSETTTWNLSTSADKIKIFTRGPIAGNLTFTSGKTVGDDIEVDVKVVKAPSGCHHAKEEDPVPPPPKPLVKVCPFKSKDGKFEGLGIFAIPPRRGHGSPPHPPHGPHDPHDPEHPHPPDDNPPHGPHIDAIPWGPPIWARHETAPPPPPPPPPPPRHPRRRSKPVLVSVDVRLPTSSSLTTSTLALRHFELAFPRFKFQVGDIKATFEYLLLLSAHASIAVQDVSAAVISVIAPGGNITGSFAVSKQIDVVSVGHAVNVNVALHSASHEKPFNATKARIVNRFGPINANISLIASSESTSIFPPTYAVESNNVKGSTNITYLSQPLNSTLFTSALGVGGFATVKTDPAFQGVFDLETPGSRPILVVPEDTKDPWGGNNKRVVHIFRGWKWWSLKGIVFWKAPETTTHPPADNPHTPLSRVKIVTKGAPASLLLG